MSALNLDLSGVSVQSSRVVVPTGNYSLEVVSCEPKETKAKTGWYLELAYRIISGEHAGVMLTDRQNIQNPNEDAQRIGLSNIKTILTVAGHKNPDALADTNEMLGLKFNAYIEENEHSFTGSDGNNVEITQNEFKGYFELSEEEAPKTTSAPPAAPETAPAPTPAPAPAPKAEAPVEKAEPEAAPAPSAGGFPWQK